MLVSLAQRSIDAPDSVIAPVAMAGLDSWLAKRSTRGPPLGAWLGLGLGLGLGFGFGFGLGLGLGFGFVFGSAPGA